MPHDIINTSCQNVQGTRMPNLSKETEVRVTWILHIIKKIFRKRIISLERAKKKKTWKDSSWFILYMLSDLYDVFIGYTALDRDRFTLNKVNYDRRNLWNIVKYFILNYLLKNGNCMSEYKLLIKQFCFFYHAYSWLTVLWKSS